MAPLATETILYHIGSMESQRDVVRQILEEAPGSIRELAREAGIAHVTLLHVRDGRHKLSPDKATAVVAALRDWSERCANLADRLEAASERQREGGSDG